jgi:siroheme synthase
MRPEMKLYIVGAGPGDPELITVKGKRLLSGAAAVNRLRLNVSRIIPGDWGKAGSGWLA